MGSRRQPRRSHSLGNHRCNRNSRGRSLVSKSHRIDETVNTPTLFGFIYATTRVRVEEGRERFLLGFDPNTEVVTYSIEAISRPRHPLAQLAYPFTRLMQHRFAGESHLRMRHAVEPHSD